LPEYDDLEGLFSDDDGEDTPEADPGTVAFLDQQSAEFNARAEHEFASKFGFVHKCRCDLDYAQGKMIEVTECYAGLVDEALEACATLKAENTLLKNLIKAAIGTATEDADAESDELGLSDRNEDYDLGSDPSDPFA